MFRLAGVGLSEGRATAAARSAPMTSSASAGEGKRGNPFAVRGGAAPYDAACRKNVGA